MKRWIVVPILSFVTLSVFSLADPLPIVSPESVGLSSERLERIAPIMQNYVDAGQVSGINTAVMRRGKIVHMESFGLRDIEGKLPMQRDTIFRIYSMSKPITTVAVMILYEEGKFELSDRVADFIPQFEDVQVYKSGTVVNLELEPANPAPTIHDLIRHTSGLTYPWGQSPVDTLINMANIWNPEFTLEQFVTTLADLPLLHQPGTKFQYSTSIDVLGYLVQVLSGMPFENFLQERIFSPLGMVDTGFYVPADKLDRFADNYQWTENETLQRIDEGDPPRYTVPPKAPSGGGGLVSTVDDYLRFCQMILNKGELDGQRILMPRTVRFMLMDHLNPDQQSGRGQGFGLGFGILRNPAQAERIGSVGEASWSGAANTFFWIDLQEELVYMVWTQLMPWGIRDFRHQMHPLVHGAIPE